MIRRTSHIVLSLLILAFIVTNCQDSSIVQNSPPPSDDQGLSVEQEALPEDGKVAENRYIVMFKDQSNSVVSAQAAQQAVEKTNAVFSDLSIPADSLIHQYKWASQGFAGRFTPEQVEKLRADPRIDHVVKDYQYKAIDSKPGNSIATITPRATFAQTTPWGVYRVNGPLNDNGKTAWILDTGIDMDHSDLNVSSGKSANFVTGENITDLHNHGSHVAGIVAAKDNSSHVVGVAAGATVANVKVCNQFGQCYVSDVKGGVDYVAGQFSSGDVANISLGYEVGSNNPRIDIPLADLESSITSAANSGLIFTIAAGNSSDDADDYSPARVNNSNVYTVSAFNENDDFASFSNYGNPPIDYGAPGVDILSLSSTGGTYTEDGTSMAAPHLAGIFLTGEGLTTDGTVNNDPDPTSDPIAVADYTPPLSVYITGDGFLQTAEQGNWTAHASGGPGSYSYQWYHRQSASDPWTSAGSDSDTFSHTFYVEANPNPAAVKVEVTSGGQTADYTFDVYVTDGQCDPQTQICFN